MSYLHISNFKAITLYCIVAFFLFFEMAVQVSPSVMASQLMHDLNIGALGLGMMSSVYFYTYTAMQIPSGLLLDRYNPRLIITLSILACSFGTLLFAYAPNIYVGALARLLMGTGSAFAFVSVLVITADLFQSKYFATITGITQMLAALGAMAGQMPISLLISYVGWRETLLVLFCIGVVLAALVWTFLNYQRMTMVSPHPQQIKSHLKIILSNKQTWLIACYACLLWVPMSSFASLWGVPYLVDVLHIDKTNAAFLCSLMWLGLAFASPLLGAISTVARNRIAPLAISALIGTVAFSLLLHLRLPEPLLGCFIFLAGAACAGQALSFAVVKENNQPYVRATAIAFNNMAVVISGALFQPLMGELIEMGQTTGSAATYDAMHFKNALLIILGAYILAFILALFFIKEPIDNAPSHQ